MTIRKLIFGLVFLCNKDKMVKYDMKIEELNKENALSIKNNLEIESDDEAADWIEDCFDFDPYLTYYSKNIKIYQANRKQDALIVTDLNNNILHWFEVYDLSVWYETKYEYVYTGHEMNCHIDKVSGKLHEYPTR